MCVVAKKVRRVEADKSSLESSSFLLERGELGQPT